MKRCSKCRTEKPEDCFWRDRVRKDGLTSWCKSCQREYRRSVAGREVSRKGWTKYNRSPKGKTNRDRYQHSEFGKSQRAIRADQHRKRHPRRTRARELAANAIRKGLIERGACSKCGTEPAEAHHPDYDKPFEVKFLCPPCHLEEHGGVF